MGKHPLIVRLLKGVFNKNPPKPRYNHTWNVSTVLNYLSSLPDNENLSLLDLSQKLLALTALVSAQRTQTLMYLDITYLDITEHFAVFQVREILKTSTPKKGVNKQIVKLPAYPANPKLCVMTTLKEYIKRTEPLREENKETKLFISSRKPHKSVTTCTLARWMKSVLASSGIDTNTFSAHSFRSASTSTAFAQGVTLNEIMKTADWSNAKTFSEFYLRTPENLGSSFGTTILDSASSN